MGRRTILGLLSIAALLALLLTGTLGSSAQQSSDSAANKALIQRYFAEFWNQGNEAVADQLVAKDAPFTQPGKPGTPAEIGPPSRKASRAQISKALSNLKLTIVDQVAEGAKVVTRWILEGDHTGSLRGEAPNGRHIVLQGMQIDRIANGQIAESYQVSDGLGFLIQLGIIPPPGTPQPVGTPTS